MISDHSSLSSDGEANIEDIDSGRPAAHSTNKKAVVNTEFQRPSDLTRLSTIRLVFEKIAIDVRTATFSQLIDELKARRDLSEEALMDMNAASMVPVQSETLVPRIIFRVQDYFGLLDDEEDVYDSVIDLHPDSKSKSIM